MYQTEAHGSHNTVGLALNGGSNTAANGGAAIMLGFQRQKLLIDGKERPAIEAFDVISGLSGGNFPNVIYHYAQNTNSDELLETSFVSDPSKITMEDLTTSPSEKSMFRTFTTDILPVMALTILYNAIYGVPAWPVAMYFNLLKPYGIRMGTLMTEIDVREGVKSTPIFETSMIGPAGELFPSWAQTKMNEGWIVDHNALLASGGYEEITEEDDPEFVAHIQVIQAIIPGYGSRIVDISKQFSLAENNGFELPIPAFGTDKDFHIPFASNAVMKFETENATAEPLNFKGFTATYDELSSESNPFTLEKMVGMATETLVLIPSLSGYLPNFEGNPIAVDIPTADGGTRKMAFTDGGYNDGTGIPALVQQKTRKIISAITPSLGLLSDESKEFINLPVVKAVGQMGGFFGLGGVPAVANAWNAANQFQHIFDLYSNGENQLTKLINNFSSLQEAGEPLITTLEGLEVIENPLFGIEGGWKVDLTIIMMIGVPQKFADQIPPGIAPPPIGKNMTEHGYFTNEEFASVPNVAPAASLGENNYTYTIPETNQTIELPIPSPLGMKLPLKAARMTQLLNSWVVERAWDGLIGSDGEEKFAGFRKLLEVQESSDGEDDDGGAGEDTSGSYSANTISWSIYFAAMLSSAVLFLTL